MDSVIVENVSMFIYFINRSVICFLQILKVLCETAVAVRTKALKCLTAVIEADPAILARVSFIATVVECLRFLVHKCCCIYALNIVDTCRLTAGTQGSALGQTLSNEYGNPLPFYLEVTQK